MKLVDLFEGLKMEQEPSGRVVIGFTPGGKDDPYFHDITDTIGKPIRREVDLHGDAFSTEEMHSLKQFMKTHPGKYQKSIPVYAAAYLQKPRDKEKQYKYQQFLDALKRRAEDTVTFEENALQEFLAYTAKVLVAAVNKEHGSQIQKADQVAVVPIPSGRQLVKQFADHILNYAKTKWPNVVSQEKLRKADVPKWGSILRSKRLRGQQGLSLSGFTPRGSELYKKMYEDILARFKKGLISEDDMIEFAEQRENVVDQRIRYLKKIQQSKHQYNVEEIQQEYNKLYDEIEYIQNEFLDKVAAANVRQVPDVQRSILEIKKVFGQHKQLVYDMFQALDDNGEGKSTNQFVILVDDNIESRRSLTDAYRVLYKAGKLTGDTEVIAVAIHELLGLAKKT